ncbi:unnamed protein product [Peniophora sp. CBMAI 1063]|nr:unnamed protein product [Peniophora sp. CBMAI 1063]
MSHLSHYAASPAAHTDSDIFIPPLSTDPAIELAGTPPTYTKSLGPETSLAGEPLNDASFALNANDMEGKWYGPIPMGYWDKYFRPRKTNFTCTPNDISFADVSTTTEGETAFARAIQASTVLAAHGIYCKDTHKLFGRDQTMHPRINLKFAPDISFLDVDMEMTAADEERLERVLGCTLCFGDLKSKNGHDPCLHITSAEDRNKLIQRAGEVFDSHLSFHTRGQLISYARAICANSHRTHLYGFVILPDYARLLFFDQSGVCFSELFDWRATSYLSDFLQYFAAANDIERGIDTSVEKISINDTLVADARAIFKEGEANDTLPDGIDFESVFKTLHSERATYWLCNVYDDHSNIFHRVLTYRVHTSTPYFAGRASRGFVAVDIDRRAVIYMKRSWRINLPGFPKERDTYREFEEAGVPHLPDCYFGGDVPRHSGTLAKEYFEWKQTASKGSSWAPLGGQIVDFASTRVSTFIDRHGREHALKDARRGATMRTDLTDEDIEMLPHVLTVTLFGKVGCRVKDFKSLRQFCVAFMHALETHEAAYRLKHILHRDVSSSNVLIYKVPGSGGEIEGLLIDWDLCANVDGRGARRKGRTGTWEFMSARMLMDPKGCVHGVRDDLESFFYLLYHHVLRYRHTVPVSKKAQLYGALRDIFTRVNTTGSGSTGGSHKLGLFQGVYPIIDEALDSATIPTRLRQLMRETRFLFQQIYAPKPPTEDGLIPYDTSQQRAVAHKDSVAKAVAECTHEHVLIYIRHVLRPDYLDWENDGPAEDQYPLPVRVDFERGKSLDRHYAESDTGISSIHSSSSLRGGMSVKRKASSLSYYSSGTGSGYRSEGNESKRIHLDREGPPTPPSDDGEAASEGRHASESGSFDSRELPDGQ